MTKKEKALKKSLDNWDKYLLKQFREGSCDSTFLRNADIIIQAGYFQKYYITIEGNKKSEMYCHFVFDMCSGINGYFDGNIFIDDIPFYYMDVASKEMKMCLER